MATTTESKDTTQRLVCGTVWGGIEPVRREVCTRGVCGSLYSTASGGNRGGDVYYMSTCSADVITRMVLADVKGHGEQVSEIGSWIYEALLNNMNNLHGAGILKDLNHIVYSRGPSAITTAVIVTHNAHTSQLYYSYAGHPPILARQSRRKWMPLLLENQSAQSDLPLGVLRSVPYSQGEVHVRAGDRLLLYTDGLSEAMNPTTEEEFGERELDAFLETLPDGDLARARDALIERAMTFTGGPLLTDDCTLILAEVR